MLVVDERRLSRNVVRVVMTRRVPVGKAAGGFGQAVGFRTGEEWCRHKVGSCREQLVGITGQKVQASAWALGN